MKRFKNILYVVNPDDEAACALERAATLAENNEASLTVVTVVPALAASGVLRGLALTVDALQSAMVGEAERHLEGFVAPWRGRVEIEKRVLVGTGFLEVIREVLRNDRDLVVKCAGSEGLLGGLLGSEDMHLLRKCPCPVMTTPRGEEVTIRRVLATIDAAAEDEVHTALNAEILGAALRVSRRTGAELHVAYAWYFPGGSLLSERGVSDETVHDLGRRQREYHGDLFRKAMLVLDDQASAFQRHLIEGKPGLVIPSFAREKEMDLIVMGTVTRTGIAGYFSGNTAEDVLGRVGCSVLAIKPPGFVTPVEL